MKRCFQLMNNIFKICTVVRWLISPTKIHNNLVSHIGDDDLYRDGLSLPFDTLLPIHNLLQRPTDIIPQYFFFRR